jgi:hypothetical protein
MEMWMYHSVWWGTQTVGYSYSECPSGQGNPDCLGQQEMRAYVHFKCEGGQAYKYWTWTYHKRLDGAGHGVQRHRHRVLHHLHL